jgi:hypothetical protein
MKTIEMMNYLKSLIHKTANKGQIIDLIETLPKNDLEYAYNYVYSIEKTSGKDSVRIKEITKENILFIRLECFLQVQL